MAKRIGTHNGSFHCDEALACHMLTLTPEYRNAEIVRTRDNKVLDTLSIIVDVGATYEPAKNRFDHHQKGFEETFSAAYKTKLSSAGLVYKHFGLPIVRQLAKCSAEDAAVIYQKVYKDFIEGLDGIDNGVTQYPGVEPLYYVNTDLSSRVGRLNPAWNEEGVDVDAQFRKAMALAGGEFEERVAHFAKAWLPARDIVKKALLNRRETDSSGEIMLLKDYTAWTSHLLELEEEMKVDVTVKYVLYVDSNKQWRIQAVPVSEKSFSSRVPLPEAWRGIRDADLSKVSGIAGGVFVHAGGFIGGNETFEGVLEMARTSLAMHKAAQG